MTTPSADTGVRFADAAEFEAWLEDNHEHHRGIWLEIAKKGSSEPTVTYPEAIEIALCFGWIDGQKARGDHAHWRQRFTPRSRRSRWSRVNRDKAEELIAAGRMRPAGLAEVERARADGRWDAAYDGQRAASSRPTPLPLRPSKRSTHATGTRSPGGSTMPSGPRPARAGSRSTSTCCAAANGFTAEFVIHDIREAQGPMERAGAPSPSQ
jgi:hypothetical protein